MTVTSFQPPRAPPDHLRLQSFQILSRLRLINEFRPWLEYTRFHIFRSHPTPLELLWDCFSFGAPLGTLLTLLGSPAPHHLIAHVDEFDFEIGIEDREEYFLNFIQRVNLLEMQGRVPYGEVLRCDDFLTGTTSAFAKILRTVYRLLIALEETYPGIFVVPRDSAMKREGLLQQLLDSERVHLSMLKTSMDAGTELAGSLQTMEPCLECLVVNRTRLVQYHDRLFASIYDVISKNAHEHWDRIFALDDDILRTRVFSAYRSICVNYLGLVSFLETTEFDPSLANKSQMLSENVSNLLSRVSEYHTTLHNILDLTLPSHPTYNTLCEAVFRLHGISENMDEVGVQLRTMRSVRSLKSRAYIWNVPDPEELGVILLDDCVMVDSIGPTECSVYLFETLLLCCQEGPRMDAEIAERSRCYPIRPWEMGPALKRRTALDIVYAIPTAALTTIITTETGSIVTNWLDKQGALRTLTFTSMSYNQWDQWISVLQLFVPPIDPSPSGQKAHSDEGDALLSEDEGEDGGRLTHAKSWSVIGRKGPCSESSSFVLRHDDESIFSPNLLPALFDGFRSPSPMNLLHSPVPPSPSNLSSDFGPSADLSALLDLTGKITREGRFPSAHGGFSDVWKGVWHDGQHDRDVAIKVLRSRVDDPEIEEKMIRRLRRELNVWKKLDHPNVLELYGTASDFGHYSSMVCPWMDGGSLSKYMEKSGDLLSISDRLKFLCEVASGLSYLHNCSIVHGDLTGSNILINEIGEACLCDFGLSSIIVEFHGTSYFTSTIGGAIRWADALLYRLPSEEEPSYAVGTWSDIYSFGSVMLEVLSGRIPYHYVRADAQVVIELHTGNKPRRPAQSFVNDDQWTLIEHCWSNDIKARPDTAEICDRIQKLHSRSLKTG